MFTGVPIHAPPPCCWRERFRHLQLAGDCLSRLQRSALIPGGKHTNDGLGLCQQLRGLAPIGQAGDLEMQILCFFGVSGVLRTYLSLWPVLPRQIQYSEYRGPWRRLPMLQFAILRCPAVWQGWDHRHRRAHLSGQKCMQLSSVCGHGSMLVNMCMPSRMQGFASYVPVGAE